MLGAFAYLASQQMVKGYSETVAAIAAGVSMMVILTFAKKREIRWLQEWALGISLVIALTIGYLTTLI
jgi:hypothetical protein